MLSARLGWAACSSLGWWVRRSSLPSRLQVVLACRRLVRSRVGLQQACAAPACLLFVKVSRSYVAGRAVKCSSLIFGTLLERWCRLRLDGGRRTGTSVSVSYELSPLLHTDSDQVSALLR